jgi:regulation of enolase protein 1 (concanavalin A-like superfamily)
MGFEMTDRYTTEVTRTSVVVTRRSDYSTIEYTNEELREELTRRQQFSLATKTQEGERRVLRAKAIELAKTAQAHIWG